MTRRVTQHRSSARLPARRKLLVNLVGLGVWGSGVLWLGFHYVLQTKGEFGPEPNVLEPWWLMLHGLLAFAALWTAGVLWAVHILAGWTLGRRRWSGAVLLGVLGLLAASGYLLYYSGSDELRAVVSKVHWIVGLGLPLLYLLHRAAERTAAKRSEQDAAEPPLRARG